LDGGIAHLLLINEMRVALAVSLAKTEGNLAWWRSDWELRAISGQGVVPDGLFEIRWEDAKRVFALEVDNNTRSVRAFLKKMIGYSNACYSHSRLCGFDDFIILVAGRDPSWLARYRGALSKTQFKLRVFFSTLDTVKNEATAAIWTGGLGDDLYSLRQLVCLPCGKEDKVCLG